MAEKTPPKKGDWVCCARRPKHTGDQPQLNYASNEGCCKAGCDGRRDAGGLEYEEVTALPRSAPLTLPRTLTLPLTLTLTLILTLILTLTR